MADLKISQLTASTTPLAGTEVLPVVQSGVTKQVSVANLTASRAVSMGTVEVTGASTQLSSEVFRTSSSSFMRLAGGGSAALGASILMFGENHGSAPGRLSLNASGTAYAEIGSADGTNHLRLSNTGDATLNNGNLVIGTAGKGIDFSADGQAAGMTSELLNDYEEGTWTPTDASGAGLTLTVVAAYYTKVGQMVTVTGRVTYPTTADSSQAIITPPFSIKGPSSFTVSTNYPSTVTGYANAGAMYLYVDSQGAITNASASNLEFNISFSYIAA